LRRFIFVTEPKGQKSEITYRRLPAASGKACGWSWRGLVRGGADEAEKSEPRPGLIGQFGQFTQDHDLVVGDAAGVALA
jgi:hypothetical protein